MNRLAPLALVPLGAVVAPACVIIDDDDPPPDPYGDISFLWSFDGITDCDEAGVDELDLVVLQGGVVVDEIEAEPCIGGGLTLTDYLAGRYEVEIDAYSRGNELLYSGSFSVRVEGGKDNDVGVVVLERVGDPPLPPPSEGSLAFFWAFLYPGDEPVIACDLAGVVDVEVLLEGPDGAEVRETFDCAYDGAIFDGLVEGDWTLHLDAYGRYHGRDLHLYAATADVTIVADEERDLGDVALARVEESFSDIQAEWDFNGTSCAAEGISSLTLSIHRTGLVEAEDVTSVDCAAVAVLRRTFVPGSYTVTLSGTGTDNTFVGSATVDVAPGTQVNVPIHLAPQ